MSGVGILCFTASYAVALGLEISKIFFRSRIRNAFTLFWILAGLSAHTAYLYYQHSVSVVPIDNAESFFLVSAWGTILVYLYLFCYHSRMPFGLIFLPIALLLIGGGVLVSHAPTGEPSAVRDVETVVRIAPLWKRIHAGTFFLATLCVCVGFVAGLLYLIQDRRLKRKHPAPTVLKLPTLEWSLSICRRAMGGAMILLAACIFSGLLLNHPSAKTPGAVAWNDPLILGTLLMFGFLLLFSTGLFETKGRTIAWQMLFAFLFLVCMLFFGALFRDAHWKRSKTADGNPSRPASEPLFPRNGGSNREEVER